MKKETIFGFWVWILAIMTIYWAYVVKDTLLREFSDDLTLVDLGVLVVLGIFARLVIGLMPVARRKEVYKDHNV